MQKSQPAPSSRATWAQGEASPNDGYLASWVPPRGKHTFKNLTVCARPKSAGEKKARCPSGQVPV